MQFVERNPTPSIATLAINSADIRWESNANSALTGSVCELAVAGFLCYSVLVALKLGAILITHHYTSLKIEQSKVHPEPHIWLQLPVNPKKGLGREQEATAMDLTF